MVKVDKLLIRLLYLCVTMMVLLQLVSLPMITSVLFYMTFLVVFLLWLLMLSRGVERMDILCLAILSMTFFNVLLNCTLENSALSFNYLKKMIMFSCTIVYFRVAVKINIEKSDERFLKRCIGVISCVFALLYIFNNDGMRMLEGRVSPYLTFKFTNPNLAAMFLLCFLVAEVVFFFRSSSSREKIFHSVLFVCLSWFVFETEARNTMLAWIVFVLVVAFFWLKKSTLIFRIPTFVAITVSIFPALFFIAYLIVIEWPIFSEIFSFIVSTGKELTSRYFVWSSGLSSFGNSPLIGAYSQMSMGTGQSQMHNTHLDIMASYGMYLFS